PNPSTNSCCNQCISMAHLSPLMGRESLPLELCYRNLMRGQTWKKGWVNRRSDSFTHSDEPSDFSKCYLS
ncbi:hypothetical protein D0Y65_054817, partial [Glycine soja]